MGAGPVNGEGVMLEHFERQSRLTGNQKRIVLVGAVANMLNFYDLFLIGYVLAFIAGSWSLSYGQSALILLASGISAIPGALFYGRMADRIGRQKVLIATAVNFSLASGAMALTPNANTSGWLFLAACQFVFGFGFAGLHTVVIPLVQGFMPTARRGWAGGLVVSGISVAGVLGAAAGASLGPSVGGWRGLCALDALPALGALAIRAWIPESPHWLIRTGRLGQARARSLGPSTSTRVKSCCRVFRGRPAGSRGASCSDTGAPCCCPARSNCFIWPATRGWYRGPRRFWCWYWRSLRPRPRF